MPTENLAPPKSDQPSEQGERRREFVPTHASLNSDGSIGLGGYIRDPDAIDQVMSGSNVPSACFQLPDDPAIDTRPAFKSRRHKALPGDCSYCDRERAAGHHHHPPHDASANCGSGRRDHCSCDTCF